MDNLSADMNDNPQLIGLPREYHRLELCQTGLGWSAYAQAQAHEQDALQLYYADMIARADGDTLDEQHTSALVRFHDAERWQAGEGWSEYEVEQAIEQLYLQTTDADARNPIEIILSDDASVDVDRESGDA